MVCTKNGKHFLIKYFTVSLPIWVFFTIVLHAQHETRIARNVRKCRKKINLIMFSMLFQIFPEFTTVGMVSCIRNVIGTKVLGNKKKLGCPSPSCIVHILHTIAQRSDKYFLVICFIHANIVGDGQLLPIILKIHMGQFVVVGRFARHYLIENESKWGTHLCVL